MTYRGNSALPPDAQRRIEGTFDQTLALAEEGNRQEALLGCDFILRMDPRFEPARRLQERLGEASGAVQVKDLRLGVDGAGPEPAVPAAEPAEELWTGLELEELPDLPPLDFPETAPAAPDGRAALRAEVAALLERRAFDAALAAAAREPQAVAGDPELAALVETAQSRLEAGPYVERFLAAARAAREEGNAAEAGRLLAKARSLDASHPEVVRLDGPPAAAEPAPEPPAPDAVAPPAIVGPDLAVPFAADVLFGDNAEFERRAGSGETESDRRIADLLGEGQGAYDRGDYQGAIDAWSRIFLIDIDHQEAAQRIEQARKLKAEGERQVEEVFHEGLGHLDAGDPAAARRSFEQVLEMQPGHLVARDLLQQIEAGKTPAARPATPLAPLDGPLRDGGGAAAAGAELKEEILVPPEPGEGRPRPAESSAPAAAARRGRGLGTFALVGGAVALLVLAGGWFLFQNRARLFPNSDAPPAAAAPVDPIARATALHAEGRTALAVAQLRRLPPDDPRYARAQTLLRQWEGGPAAPLPQPAALAPELAARREEMIGAARAALGGGDYLAAVERLEQAQGVQRLAAPEAELLRQARAGLAPLAPQLAMFEQQDWEFVVPQLWRLREANPADATVRRLLVDSYHNLGVQALQQEEAQRAESHFKEALQLAPDDAETHRHLLFAQTYQQRTPDLLYRIYVKHLPFRGP
ncbi:MAG TPA: tetratricopeptide repeat protein [Thermoanaerobaculia bacterium]|nr:tetratricopeptide repeat protein [Thermoanaerobaculia bacterium]